jgi:hypothetical protein
MRRIVWATMCIGSYRDTASVAAGLDAALTAGAHRRGTVSGCGRHYIGAHKSVIADGEQRRRGGRASSEDGGARSWEVDQTPVARGA